MKPSSTIMKMMGSYSVCAVAAGSYIFPIIFGSMKDLNPGRMATQALLAGDILVGLSMT
jgi:hypothetical protein